MPELVYRAWNDLETFGFFTHPTLTSIDSYGGQDQNVIYAILHEAIYCQGWGPHSYNLKGTAFTDNGQTSLKLVRR